MGILSPFYDASFDGVSFWEQDQGNARAGRDVTTDGTLYSLGGGTHIYVDMGETAQPFNVVAAVEGAQLTSLRAKRGVSGSLVWSRGTWTATLLDVQPTPGKAGDLDAYTVTLRLFSTSLPTGAGASTAFLTETGETFVTESGEAIIQE